MCLAHQNQHRQAHFVVSCVIALVEFMTADDIVFLSGAGNLAMCSASENQYQAIHYEELNTYKDCNVLK